MKALYMLEAGLVPWEEPRPAWQQMKERMAGMAAASSGVVRRKVKRRG